MRAVPAGAVPQDGHQLEEHGGEVQQHHANDDRVDEVPEIQRANVEFEFVTRSFTKRSFDTILDVSPQDQVRVQVLVRALVIIRRPRLQHGLLPLRNWGVLVAPENS